MADLGWSNVLAGLIGGVGASVLTFAGALYLQTHNEQRLRRARLSALETELRWNRMIIHSLVREKQMMGDLDNHCWRDNYVALATDLPEEAYSDLRLFYFAFARVEESYHRLRQGKGDKEGREFLEWWFDHVGRLQVTLAGELHPKRKLQFLVGTLVTPIMRLIRRNEKKATEKDEK